MPSCRKQTAEARAHRQVHTAPGIRCGLSGIGQEVEARAQQQVHTASGIHCGLSRLGLGEPHRPWALFAQGDQHGRGWNGILFWSLTRTRSCEPPASTLRTLSPRGMRRTGMRRTSGRHASRGSGVTRSWSKRRNAAQFFASGSKGTRMPPSSGGRSFACMVALRLLSPRRLPGSRPAHDLQENGECGLDYAVR